MDIEVLHTTKLDYEHMSIKKLQNIIKTLEFYGYVDNNQSLIKVLDKRINKIYNPEKDRKNKNKTLIKYRKRG